MEDSDGQCLGTCSKCNSPSSMSCGSGYTCNSATGVCETSGGGGGGGGGGGLSSGVGYPDCLILTELCQTGQCPAGSPTISAVPLGGHCDPTHVNNCETNHRYCVQGTCQECPTPGNTATGYNTCGPPNSFDATQRAAICGGSSVPRTCLPRAQGCLPTGDGVNWLNCTVDWTLSVDNSRCDPNVVTCFDDPACPHLCDITKATKEYSYCACREKRIGVYFDSASSLWCEGDATVDENCNACFYTDICPVKQTNTLNAQQQIQPETSTECVPILNNGDPNIKLDIVFVAGDYAQDQSSEFSAKANEYANNLLSVSPFRENKNKINVWLVNKFDNIGCQLSDIANVEGVRLVACDAAKTKLLARKCPNDQIIVIANMYGASNADFGGVIARISTTHLEGDLLKVPHEFGHSFGSLWDEYSYGIPYSSGSDNPTIDVVPNCDNSDACPKWAGMAECVPVCGFTDWYKSISYIGIMNGGFAGQQSTYGPISEKRLVELLNNFS